MISRGIIAGLFTTLALSIIMVMKAMMGVMPAFNIISDWTQAVRAVGLTISPVIAWVLHFTLGALWGVLFALFHRQLPGGPVVSGILVGVLAWLGMMVGFMPVAGNGVFALGIGPMVTMATLVLHLFFGAVLGLVYKVLDDRSSNNHSNEQVDRRFANQTH